MLNALEYLFPFKILIWKGTWFRIAKCRCFFPLHILQCLPIQDLTSSGGGSSVGGDGGNSSGVSKVSRALSQMFWPGGISEVQDVKYAIWGTSSKAILVDSSWHWFESLLWLAVAEVLLPAYRSFVKRFGCLSSYLK